MTQPVCPWCNKVPAGKVLSNGGVSHGICPGCAAEQLEIARLEALWNAEPDDGLGPARGVAAGLVLAVGLWGLGVMLWRWMS